MPDTQPIRAFLDDRHLRLAREVQSFVAEHIASQPAPGDDAHARELAPRLVERMGRAGWFAHLDPFDLRACCLIREALAHASPLADDLFAIQGLFTQPILLSGGAGPWIERAKAGAWIGGFAMTEREAGSDVGALQTRARADGDGYVLDGEKTLISNAGLAHAYVVFASTQPEAGHRGITCFVVEADNPGLRFVRPLVLSSPHPLGEIALESCRVAASARLGAEGGGFKLGMATLDRMRPTVAAAACGMATRALDESFGRATSRRQFGSPIAEYQLVQQKLARMATDLTAARLLTYQAAWELDTGKPRISLESAMSKYFATEAAQRIVDDAVQIHGGSGVLADHPVDRLYRSVRALRIYEGTTEIQQVVIARQLLKQRAERG